jgi:hypothetical protein
MEKARDPVRAILCSAPRVRNTVKRKSPAHGAHALIRRNRAYFLDAGITEIFPDPSAVNAAFGKNIV